MALNMRDWFTGTDRADSDPDEPPGLYVEGGVLSDPGHHHKGVIPFDPDPDDEKIVFGVPVPSHINERRLPLNLSSF